MIYVHLQFNPSYVCMVRSHIHDLCLKLCQSQVKQVLLSNLSSWTRGLLIPSCLTVGALRTRAHSEYCFSEIISKNNQQAARMWTSAFSFWLGNAAYSTVIEKHRERIEVCFSPSLFKIKTIKYLLYSKLLVSLSQASINVCLTSI